VSNLYSHGIFELFILETGSAIAVMGKLPCSYDAISFSLFKNVLQLRRGSRRITILCSPTDRSVNYSTLAWSRKQICDMWQVSGDVTSRVMTLFMSHIRNFLRLLQ
jgi:hypothetical protein